jgi:hypothetical protein
MVVISVHQLRNKVSKWDPKFGEPPAHIRYPAIWRAVRDDMVATVNRYKGSVIHHDGYPESMSWKNKADKVKQEETEKGISRRLMQMIMREYKNRLWNLGFDAEDVETRLKKQQTPVDPQLKLF